MRRISKAHLLSSVPVLATAALIIAYWRNVGIWFIYFSAVAIVLTVSFVTLRRAKKTLLDTRQELEQNCEKLNDLQTKLDAAQRIMNLTASMLIKRHQQDINRAHNAAIERAARLCDGRTDDPTLSKAILALQVKPRRQNSVPGNIKSAGTTLPAIEQ